MSDRAPRIRLTEQQRSEPREAVPMLPAIRKMAERFAKSKEIDLSEAVERMVLIAVGRLGALHRYTVSEEES